MPKSHSHPSVAFQTLGSRLSRRSPTQWPSEPLFEFRNYGQPLPHNWSTISNESAFGTDYFTRTAVAKSNILVNAPYETKYFYQDLDANGERLHSAHRYEVRFATVPPVHGFWSLSIYNQHHFFVANPINRFSVGTKNKDLVFGADGSLTIYVQADPPLDPAQRANWLPAPDGDVSLYIRAYWPTEAVTNGSWTPPAVQVAGQPSGREAWLKKGEFLET